MANHLKPTSGEWQVHSFGSKENLQTHIHANNVRIAKISQIDEAEANAQLIAAAPELLEALQHLLREARANSTKLFGDYDDTFAEQKAQQAINKATMQ